MDAAREHAFDHLVGTVRARLLREAAEEPLAGGSVEDRVRAAVDAQAGALDARTREELHRRVVQRTFGLGVLEPLLADPAVDEILVSGTGPVWVERRGRLERTDVAFAREADLRHAIDRILAPLGRRVDESEPLCDTRLADGSRVNVVLPPLAVDGPALTIRRFRAAAFTPDELVASGTWRPEIRDLLRDAVGARLNVLVSGGTGSGKTTTLGALTAFFAATERVVTIEDTAELRTQSAQVVRLEARPPSVEGRGEVTIRRLVRNALRMRPDRIVVGEVRGPEALDMLAAMASGHDGSLCTVHADGPAQALRRVETLALMADVGLPHAAIREQVAAAVHLVVHQVRDADGARRVAQVGAVDGDGDDGAPRVVPLLGPDGALRPLPPGLRARLTPGANVHRTDPEVA
jgi:pilus assembly protein CpaF